MANTLGSLADSEALRANAEVAPIARLLADPARAAMLWALSDGRALPAGELARMGAVSPSIASVHLTKLSAGGLVIAERHGRHRYFRLGDSRVVAALDALAAIAPPGLVKPSRRTHAAHAIRQARTCYDHLAGTLGVRLTQALINEGSLHFDHREYRVSRTGMRRFAELGVDVSDVIAVARRTRRPLARACLDWTERRYHLAGALGAALVDRFLGAGWVERLPSTRALPVTTAGRRAFRRMFDVHLI